jgi:LmbE family N-acetylglucosaminyl deacetylase
MKFLNSKKVLCVGAHPDDVEYGMAGTFSKCTDTDFIVLVMSDGGDFDKTTTYEDRREENENVWNVFENVNGVVNNQDFVKNQPEDEMVNFIETNFKDFDLIVTTPQEDSHFEHRMINNLGPALCRRSPITLVEYRTPSTLNHWIPNHFEPLEPYDYEVKKAALKKFTSQQKAPYFKEKCIDSFHHNFLCSKKGLIRVESYRIVESYSL